MKKILKGAGMLLGVVLALAVLFFAYLCLTEYRPADAEEITVAASGAAEPFSKDTFTVLTFNTGYAGLGKDADFFMDGGKSVRSADEDLVNANMSAILEAVLAQNADFVFLQEVDEDSTRTYHIDEVGYYAGSYARSAYALNFSCAFVPYPVPPIGKVTSGVLTLTNYEISSAQRISLPLSFSWPVRIANLKRCMLIARVPIEGSGRELVLINFHLEAYDDGQGKKAQTELLISTMETEYEKGNYVVAGGDWNQSFSGWEEYYPIISDTGWVPGILEEDILPEGWRFACDLSSPSCRSLEAPYAAGETQLYLIDGFVVSPNLAVEQVETIDLGFENSDHNPVKLVVSLSD